MKTFPDKLKAAQTFLQENEIDGWLLYDFKRLNPLACLFLEIAEGDMLTRRFFYWIPKEGEPVKIVSAVENPLTKLPGSEQVFTSWHALDEILKKTLANVKKIAMEYSPHGRVPEVSKVDAGTIERVRSFDVQVVSSGDLYSQVTATLSEAQQESQKSAAAALSDIAAETWKFIATRLGKITELEAQKFIADKIKEKGCVAESLPIVAVNAHSADPHWQPDNTVIQENDFILIDLWCKENKEGSIYGDITRVGVARKAATAEENKIFNLVREAQKAATHLVTERFKWGQKVHGWEVDQKARDVITAGGFGPFFVHRTGHNIHEKDHGPGCHIDNLETEERRLLLKETCCSIEPGIYLPGKFGVRLEYDLLIDKEGKVEITGGEQNEITCLLT